VVGVWFGFVTPPPLFFGFVIGATLAYLTLVEVTKVAFYHVMAEGGATARKLTESMTFAYTPDRD
jgi:Mg2+-importing ATPase